MSPLERACRAMMRHFDVDPDVYVGMYGGYGDWLNATGAVLRAIKYEDGTDEATLIDVTDKHRVETVSFIEAYDDMIDTIIIAGDAS